MFERLRQPFFEMDSGNAGGGESAGDNESASSNSDPSFTPGWGLPKEVNQAAGSNPLLSLEPAPPETVPPAVPKEPPAAQKEPLAPNGQVFDFSGRKIEVADPTIAAALKDVHKDYSALQGTFTQTSQRMKELEQANQAYVQLLSTMQPNAGQPNANQPEPQPAPPSAEEAEKIKSDFMDKFYDNPLSAIEGLLDSMFQQKVQPIIEPITQEREWNEQVKGLTQKYSDFQEFIAPMQQLLTDMPELAQHGLEGVYQLAKRTQAAPQPAAPTPDELLNDTNFRQQIMQDPEMQKQFLSQYLQEKQGSQQQAPVMMGAQPGGNVPAAGEQRPTDIRSASKAFKRSLGIY